MTMSRSGAEGGQPARRRSSKAVRASSQFDALIWLAPLITSWGVNRPRTRNARE